MAKWRPRKQRETGKTGVEAQSRDYMRSKGGKSWKFTSPGHKGVPDRLYSHANCGPFFMEHKAHGKAMDELQDIVCDEMAQHGIRVYRNVDSLEKAKNIIDMEVFGV